ncbi:MAG: RNA polymerase-binding protein RbpA [Galactobacter sp.]|uniref:RNA polymerase-binding protein RbpA n=1 Tax=Galactobacter sp. TaxID=2676125 RepID=UPI0025BC6E67|nr:RNA polymerase-binding protein RbpA [Galactobacter sp.]
MSDRSLRGMRLGSQSMESEAGVEPAARQTVTYFTEPAAGEEVERVDVVFAMEADVPAVWYTKSGKKAHRSDGAEEEPSKEKPVRTHWDMLLERRSSEELEVILADRLKFLREARGEKVDA